MKTNTKLAAVLAVVVLALFALMLYPKGGMFPGLMVDTHNQWWLDATSQEGGVITVLSSATAMGGAFSDGAFQVKIVNSAGRETIITDFANGTKLVKGVSRLDNGSYVCTGRMNSDTVTGCSYSGTFTLPSGFAIDGEELTVKFVVYEEPSQVIDSKKIIYHKATQQAGQPGSLCGNGILDSGETCSSCPADVICPSGTQCSSGQCISGAMLPPTGAVTLGDIPLMIGIAVAVMVLLVLLELRGARKRPKVFT